MSLLITEIKSYNALYILFKLCAVLFILNIVTPDKCYATKKIERLGTSAKKKPTIAATGNVAYYPDKLLLTIGTPVSIWPNGGPIKYIGGYATEEWLGGGEPPRGFAVNAFDDVSNLCYLNFPLAKVIYSYASTGGPTARAIRIGAVSIAVDAAGNIYAVDSVSNDVKKIPKTGSLLITPTVIGTGFSGPTGVAVDRNGNLYVADNGNNAVKKIPAGGGVPVAIGGVFDRPYNVAVDALGNVYVTEVNGGNTFKKINADGSGTVSITSNYGDPKGIAVDKCNDIYLTCSNHSVVTIQASDVSRQAVIGTATGESIAVNSYGSVLISKGPNGTGLHAISPTGGFFITPALPEGLKFDRATGYITGTPTKASPPTDYMVTAWNGSIYYSNMGNIKITVSAGAPAPVLVNKSGPLGTLINITGQNLGGVTEARIGDSYLYVTSNTDKSITAVAPGTASSGAITLKYNNTVYNLGSFTITPSPAPIARQKKFTVNSDFYNLKLGNKVMLTADGKQGIINSTGRAFFYNTATGEAVQPITASRRNILGSVMAMNADGKVIVATENGLESSSAIYRLIDNEWHYQFRYARTGSISLNSTGERAANASYNEGYPTFQIILGHVAKDILFNKDNFTNIASVASDASGALSILGLTNLDTTKANDAGKARIDYVGSSSVGTMQYLTSAGSVGNSRFGYSGAFSSEYTAIAGGPGDDNGKGAVWVYTYTYVNYIGNWQQQGAKLVGTGAIGAARQGTSVAISADGNTILIGGPGDNGGIGASWIFTRDKNGVWTQYGDKIVAPDAIGAAQQGASVALSADGSTAMIGAPGDDGGKGAAWAYVVPPPAPEPTVPSLKLTFTNTTATSTTANWTSGNGAKRAVFIAKTANGVASPLDKITYSAATAFSAGTQIGNTGWYCIYNGNGASADVTGLTEGTTYRVTVVEYNGEAANEKYMLTKLNPASVVTLQQTVIPPTVSSLKLTYTNTTYDATTVSWTSGNGAMRAVFVAKTANGVANPVDATTYNANTAFGAGRQIGTTGWYCIYNGTGNSVNITGLLGSTTYRVTVVEYNGTPTHEKFMLTKLNPASVITLPSPVFSPTVPSIKLTFTNTTPISTLVSWTSGNGAKRAVFACRTANGVANAIDNTVYAANPNIAVGTQIGTTGWYCIYNGTGSSASLTGLAGSTTYRVTVIEYNGSGGAEKYMNTKLNPASVITLASGSLPPTVPSLKLTFTNTTNAATTVSWTSGNGTKRAAFIARTANGVVNTPDNTTYAANTNFGAGTQVGATGWYCIYNGVGNNVTVTGLSANTTYKVTVIEYNGNAGTEKYMNTMLNPASVITKASAGIVESTPDGNKTVNFLADTKVEASNLLSPNGDGKNDTWIVKNIDQYPNNSVTVYDQSSGIIFNKKGYTNDWAGTYRGATVNEGTYYYLVDLGNGTTIKGFITVLRSRQ